MLGLFLAALRSRLDLLAENIALRHQLAVLMRQRPTFRTRRRDRWLWILLRAIWPRWRDALVIVKPATVVGWHRRAFRAFWTWKSRHRSGRPGIAPDVRRHVRRMVASNPTWGAPRIHGEVLKLGIDISQRTVSRLMPRRRNPPSQTWRAFLRNHGSAIASVDFFTVPTASFRVLYVFVVLRHDRRRIVHVNVTEHPTAEWTAQQIVEAFPWDEAPRYLLRDRDAIYGDAFRRRVKGMGIEEINSAPRSPWQNSFVERVIGTLRRELLDHVIVADERHLLRLLRDYLAYYHDWRCHLSLDKDAPHPRRAQSPSEGRIVEIPEVGGLHHHYERRAA